MIGLHFSIRDEWPAFPWTDTGIHASWRSQKRHILEPSLEMSFCLLGSVWYPLYHIVPHWRKPEWLGPSSPPSLLVSLVPEATVSVSVKSLLPGSAMPPRSYQWWVTLEDKLWQRMVNCVKDQDGNVWNRLPRPKAQIYFPKLFLLLMANAEWHAWGCALLGTLTCGRFLSKP